MTMTSTAHRLLTAAFVLTAGCLPVRASAQAPIDPRGRTIFDEVPAEKRTRYEAAAIPLWSKAATANPEDPAVLFPVLPPKGETPRAAILVVPGGAYRFHSAPEAFPIAEHYREAGIAAFVLKYRLQGPRDPAALPLADAQRAVRVIRSRATELGVDPGRVAAIGFSAGAHVIANLSVHGDDGRPDAEDPVERQGCRLQTAVLMYPWIVDAQVRAPGADRSFAALARVEGLPRLVDARTPPTFLLVGYDDTRTPYEHTLAYVARLHEAGVRFELHVLGRGEHGASVREERLAIWTALVHDWLQARGIAPPAGPPDGR